MSFKDIHIKPYYNSDEDDVLNDFYIPVLKEAIFYRRLTGAFSSSILAGAAKGISKFIINKGQMELICWTTLFEKDVKAVEKGIKKPESIINNIVTEELDWKELEDKLQEDHLKALAWMVANETLEIRIALKKDKIGSFIPGNRVAIGKFHPKSGLLRDSEGNEICFSGSENESIHGWKFNIEEFHVYKGWEKDDNKHFNAQKKAINRFWVGETKATEVYSFPEALKKSLINMAPKRIEDIIELELEEKLIEDIINQKKEDEWESIFNKVKGWDDVEIWDHQKNAIKEFRENLYKGIYKMATGTGKTYAALFSLKEYFNEVKEWGNRILIIVPQENLIKQWIEDLYDFTSGNDLIFPYYSKVKDKEKKDARNIWKSDLKKNDKFNIYLVITIHSIDKFKPFKMLFFPDFIIADEVHSYGTEKRMEKLKETLGNITYGLGLSATPERYYDPKGTERVVDFFGPILCNYDIKSAQKDEVLANYNYYPYIVELTPHEENEIKELTNGIGKDMAINYQSEIAESEGPMIKSVEKKLILRAKKVKKAENKLKALREILTEYGRSLKQCIVYCEEGDQLDDVQGVFEDLQIYSYVKYHSKIKNRDEALNLFKKKNCNFILSMHCLDQGINIPSCESLILLSSSRNPREYIQRRGRVLRNPPDIVKPTVKIFDIFAFPRDLNEIYKGLVMGQLIRAWEFIRCSQTPEAKIKLDEILDSYNIYNEELEEIIMRW